ncbi:hypothetical protein DM01DRAFT_1336645 [Hesseltinella vesiculosa]|uniref:Uncharacterized protein n=1 Tax=Hesseltinella vesiculosa TaxID=101127 RepID=A0A1X2GFY7_9FUNG|nr:hypothetical protein DM01DRAFT_1336645 [Hesseltinella vesiculosa]
MAQGPRLPQAPVTPALAPPLKKHKPDARSCTTLLSLPHELLCQIFIYASNPALPIVCRQLMYHLYACHDSTKLLWLLHRFDDDPEQALLRGAQFRFFTHALLQRLDRWYQKQGHGAPVPFNNKVLPAHLFAPVDAARQADNHRLLKSLLERGASASRPNNYPLIKSAQQGDQANVQLLVAHGANPSARNNLALRLCATRNNKSLVLYLLDTLKVQPDADTLKACAQRELWDMVQILMDHGAVPDMNTVNFSF